MDFTEIEQGDVWFLQSDLSSIKHKAMALAKESSQFGLGSLLSNVYGKNDEDTQHALNRWACHGSSRRGLERWINRSYCQKRSDIRRRTIKSLVRAQRKMVLEGCTDQDYRWIVLARLCEALSRDARLFARVLGKADEYALQEEAQMESRQQEILAHGSSNHDARLLTSPPARPKRASVIASPVHDLRHFY